MSEKRENVKWEELSPDDRMKYEIAEELGLLEKVREQGWKSLSAIPDYEKLKRRY